MNRAVDPMASLSRFERSLLRVSAEHGVRPFAVVVGACSVAISAVLTAVLMVALDSTREEFIVGFALSIVVPALVAPVVAVVMGRLLRALDIASAELHHLSRVDALTGVLNRRALAVEAESLLGTGRAGEILVAMVDIDDFKGVNDRHGHGAGDEVLVALAGRLRAAVDPAGIVGRFGGDEFVVVARVTDFSATVAGLHAACDLGDVVPGVSASLGIHAAHAPVSLVDAMAAADGSLYDEKATTKGFSLAGIVRDENRSAQVEVVPPK